MSKVWTNIANAVVTYIIITHADKAIEQPEVILYYLGAVGGYEIVKRYISAKSKQVQTGEQYVYDTRTDK